MARLLLKCWCERPFIDGETPRCLEHQETRVVRTIGMRAPTFRGTVTGPHATTEDLPAWTGRLVGGESHG